MLQKSRNLSILLVLLSLTIAGCLGNSAEEARIDDDAVVEMATPEAISSGTVTASLLNIHETPGTDAPILYEAPAGTEVDIFSETAMGDSIWYQVRARSEALPSDLGWAFSRYIDTGENSSQGNSSAGNQPSNPPAGGGSGSSSGGSGGLDPEAPGANPDIPGTIDPEAPGANPDNPGGSGSYPGESVGGSGSYPGESVGGSGGYPGDDSSRPSSNDSNSRPSVGG